MTRRQHLKKESFEITEAAKLLDSTILLKGKRQSHTLAEETYQEASIGRVVGVLKINSEIEIVVQFGEHLTQLTKLEFNDQIEAIADDE